MLISDILRNNVKEKLARDEVVASMTVRLIRTIEIARIARTAGFDSLYVDLEHSSFSLETCGQICMAAVEAGIAPFVRVPANTPDYICPRARRRRARDHRAACPFRRRGQGGGAGRPNSRRSASARTPAAFRICISATFPAPEAYAALNDATMVIVQFESAAALDKTEEIVAVDGVDLVLVGLNDLLADWGIPGQYDHPRVREAYASTIAACRRHGKHCGVGGLSTRPDLVAEFVRMGARYVSTGTDLAFLMSACTARAKQVQEIKL